MACADVGDARDRIVRVLAAIRAEFGHALADVDAQIANPLQIGHQFERGGDEAQIGGDRLAARQNLNRRFVDFELQLIDGAIEFDRAAREQHVAIDVRPHRQREHLFHVRAHQQYALAQALQLSFVFSVGVPAIHVVVVSLSRSGP